MMSQAGVRRAGERYLLLGALLLYCVYIGRNAFRIHGEVFFSLFDDAMISMRYAQSLAEGHGLVWNPGEAPVEGYTNFLWTLLMAGAHLLGLADSKVALVVSLLSGACLLVNALVVRRIAERVSPDAWVSLAALALTLFSYPLIFWSLRGMEVGFLTLLVDVGVLAVLQLRERFGWQSLGILCLSAVLALLTRPDSVTPVAVLGAFAWLNGSGRERWAVACALGASVVGTLGAHTLFRYAYYGELLPNTYYLKMAGTPLVARLTVGVPAFVRSVLLELWPLFVLPVVCLIRSPQRLVAQGRAVLLAVLAVQCVYSMYVGGDAWEHMTIANRYIATALPGAFVLLGALLGDLYEQPASGDLRLVCCVIGAAAVVSTLAAFFYHFTTPLFASTHVRTGQLPPYVLMNVVILAAALYVAKKGLPSAPLLAWGLMLAPLWLALDGMAFANWRKNHATVIDQEMTRIGIAVKEASKPNARIAVTYAGAPPYFSRLPSTDLLGKCDRVISHKTSYLPFLPGHSKWDYHYTLSTYHPDLILQTFRLNQRDRDFLSQSGYVRLQNGVYFLDASRSVDRSLIAAIPFQMHHIFEEP